jgi:deoxyribodipyrimidine photo-lyase
MIEDERVKQLNEVPIDNHGQYVLYWMSQSQREPHNPALEYALRRANELDKSMLCAFAVDANYPDANLRHFAFMLEGLAETATRLAKRGIKLVGRFGAPPAVVGELAADAVLVVCDRGYLRHQRRWRSEIADSCGKAVVQIEGDVVVPVEVTSDKQEWAARTIRGKIERRRDNFVRELQATPVRKSSLPLHVTGDRDFRDASAVLRELDIDRSVARSERFKAGTEAARSALTSFLRRHLDGYADARNAPDNPQASRLSPYLHFGQISPVEVAAKVMRANSGTADDKQAFLEELIVRRELAVNFVFFCADYDQYACLPDWASQTLAAHRDDSRPERYTRQQLEDARTKDPYWNAAMQEMRKTGYMHNYMRMYWGKKIIEWTNTPRYAYSTALYLNNKYFLDGRDPNSYANVGWIFGLHDRAWAERDVFGKVRYMSASGLESKFDINAYVDWVESL